LKSWSGGPAESIVAQQVQATVEAIPVGGGRPVGWIDERVIADALELLQGSKEIEAPKPVTTYYTNALLQ
jgi:NitT/TauT family transport system substrate-binding protein